MREHKLNLIENFIQGTNNKNKPKRKSFGYQTLGFGSGSAAAPFDLHYLVVAGGGGGGGGNAGGAGAGGFRISYDSPLANPGGALPDLAPGSYAVTVGGGGAQSPGPDNLGTQGVDSVFNPGGSEGTNMITSSGGGKGLP